MNLLSRHFTWLLILVAAFAQASVTRDTLEISGEHYSRVTYENEPHRTVSGETSDIVRIVDSPGFKLLDTQSRAVEVVNSPFASVVRPSIELIPVRGWEGIHLIGSDYAGIDGGVIKGDYYSESGDDAIQISGGLKPAERYWPWKWGGNPLEIVPGIPEPKEGWEYVTGLSRAGEPIAFGMDMRATSKGNYVRGVTVTGARIAGVFSLDTVGLVVESCRFENTPDKHATFEWSTDWVARNNTFVQTERNGRADGGVGITNYNSGGLVENNRFYGCSINVLSNSQPTKDVTIRGNRVYNGRIQVSGGWSPWLEGLAIEGNYVEGIIEIGTGPLPNNDVRIIGNIVHSRIRSRGIWLEGVSGVVRDNEVFGATYPYYDFNHFRPDSIVEFENNKSDGKVTDLVRRNPVSSDFL